MLVKSQFWLGFQIITQKLGHEFNQFDSKKNSPLEKMLISIQIFTVG